MRVWRSRPKVIALLSVVIFFIYLFRDFASFKKMDRADTVNGQVTYIAKNLVVRYTVLSNTGPIRNQHEVILTNNGREDIKNGPWSIYFNHLYLPDIDHMKKRKSHHLSESKFLVEHLDGGLFRLIPSILFEGIKAGTSVILNLKAYTIAARCYVLPRWYVTAPGAKPQLIEATDDDTLSFVSDFNSPHLWKRNDYDYSRPFTPQARFKRYNVIDFGAAPLQVVPTPLTFTVNETETVDLSSGDWSVCKSPDEFSEEITKFADTFQIRVIPEKEPSPPTHYVSFVRTVIPEVPVQDEAYRLTIDASKPSIKIEASHPKGVFYATQTLLSLAEPMDGIRSAILPSCVIKDSPRYGYRGLHLDVARNFVEADDVISILKAMALYKLNKFHFHLTDDEGWRVEIADLPELTEIGAKRCHTEDERDCIFPALGSGPDIGFPGSGFYSADDYRRILKAAAELHIEVIPEIDMPGHSHAAIKAMESRYFRLMDEGKVDEASEFLLSDFLDDSPSMSVQHYRNNAINPCLPSAMRFVEKVVDSLILLHSEIQPLRVFHVGGDEVAANSWRDSPVCQDFIDSTQEFPLSHKDLQEHFMQQVARVVSQKEGLELGAWEDGALSLPGEVPFNKSHLSNVEVTTYAWNNDWLKKTSQRAYALANAGYKVVLSLATHLYFDHPHEPDPEELGLFWATRYSDDRKVYGFLPDDLYGNAQENEDSVPFTAEERDAIRENHLALEKTENVIGIQAQVWSELLRDVSSLHHQLFPRLIVFAERAWHRADWEEEDNRKYRNLKHREWVIFANTVGRKELPRLKSRGIKYRVPPPGVRFDNGTLEICTVYPGFRFKMRTVVTKDDETIASDWSECYYGQPIENTNQTFEFVTVDGDRESRIVKLDGNKTEKSFTSD